MIKTVKQVNIAYIHAELVMVKMSVWKGPVAENMYVMFNKIFTTIMAIYNMKR